jgi:hypothetical protein
MTIITLQHKKKIMMSCEWKKRGAEKEIARELDDGDDDDRHEKRKTRKRDKETESNEKDGHDEELLPRRETKLK